MTTYAPSSVCLRNYEEIFTGSNQQNGYKTPFLGFDARTSLQLLVADDITYFHYPIFAPTISLSAAGLIEDGSIAGSIPYRSDKIWKKQADYHKYIWFGDASLPQQGTWLCAWLSGSPDGQNSIWMDRWYNPGHLDPLAITPISGYYVNSPAVYDEPSSMTFEPGVWYRYQHIGNKYNQSLVDGLTSNNTSISSLLVSHLDIWTYPMIDDSIYNNQITLHNFSNEMIQATDLNQIQTNDSSLYLNGTQYAEINFNDNLNIDDKITATIWVRSNDWNNVRGREILGRSFRGGWSIYYDNGFYTPTFSIMGSGGILLQGNNNGNVMRSSTLPGSPNPINCTIDNDLYTWIIDNGIYDGFKHLYKVDYDGTIEVQIPFNPTVNLSDITIDGDSNVWVLDTIGGYASGFDAQGNYIQRVTQSGSNLDITSQGILSSLACTDMCFDNTDTLYHISSGNLYQNTTLIYNDSELYRIKCDKDNNFWVLKTPNIFIKMDTTGNVILSGNIDNTSGSMYNLSLTNEYDTTVSHYRDFVWFTSPNTNKLYKFDENGTRIKAYNQEAFNAYPSNKNFTSYDWNRKFNYLAYTSIPQIKAEIRTGTASVSGKYTIAFPTSGFNDDEWHHFALVYDGTVGNYSFMVDSINRGNISLAPNSNIYYNYENNISIGTDSGKMDALDVSLGTDKLSFSGYLDDIRIYNSILDSINIRNIMSTKFQFHDLKWNMPTGSQNYLEEIERFFKFKAPGSKSQYYNIKLSGLQITDTGVRGMIEDIIRQTVVKISPLYAELYKIIWE